MVVVPEPARSWALRWGVELCAAPAFMRLARELEDLAYPAAFVAAFRAAAEDEQRHARLCEELALGYGAERPADLDEPLSFAPKGMTREQAMIYDVAARCCVAETESMATLVTLLPKGVGRAKEIVHEISRDEVTHARLGWDLLRHLAEKKRDVSFLAPHLVRMLRANGDFTFDAAPEPGREADGVLSTDMKRDVFVECVTDVVLPGFDHYGVDTNAARTWLAERIASHAVVPVPAAT